MNSCRLPITTSLSAKRTCLHCTNPHILWPQQANTTKYWCQQARSWVCPSTTTTTQVVDPGTGRVMLPHRCRILVCCHRAGATCCQVQDLSGWDSTLQSHLWSPPSHLYSKLTPAKWAWEPYITTSQNPPYGVQFHSRVQKREVQQCARRTFTTPSITSRRSINVRNKTWYINKWRSW